MLKPPFVQSSCSLIFYLPPEKPESLIIRPLFTIFQLFSWLFSETFIRYKWQGLCKGQGLQGWLP